MRIILGGRIFKTCCTNFWGSDPSPIDTDRYKQTIKERRSYERRSERRSRFHEREVSAALIFKKERKSEHKNLLKKVMIFSVNKT